MASEAGTRSRGVPARAAVLLALAVAAVAAIARLTTVGEVFSEGTVRVPPVDDLYHARRILEAVERPAFLSEPDPRRGVDGAFCPWPPGWDLSAALLARALGRRGEPGILTVVVFIPPLVGTLLAGAGCFLVSRRWGLVPGFVTGFLLALTPALLEVSSAGQIDHHFLEPPLLLVLLAATLGVARAGHGKRAGVSGLVLGVVLSAALFVQVSLLLAAGVALAALLAVSPGPRALGSAALGFGLAGGAVAAYRLSRPDRLSREPVVPRNAPRGGAPGGGPRLRGRGGARALRPPPCDGEAPRRGVRGPRAPGRPGVRRRLPGGRALPRGRPVARPDRGVPAAPRTRRRERLERAPRPRGRRRGRARSSVPPVPRPGLRAPRPRALRARSPRGRVRATEVRRAGRALPRGRRRSDRDAGPEGPGGRWRPAAWATVALVPTLVGALPYLREPRPIVSAFATPLRAARFLREAPPAGRVLGPWYLGHAFDVLGRRGVLVDGFGTMPGRFAFESAHEALVSTDEDRLVASAGREGCGSSSSTNPLVHLARPPGRRAGRGMTTWAPPGPERRRGYAPPAGDGLVACLLRPRQGSSQRGAPGRPLRSLRLVYVDPEPATEPPPYGGPALEVWEIVDAPLAGHTSPEGATRRAPPPLRASRAMPVYDPERGSPVGAGRGPGRRP